MTIPAVRALYDQGFVIHWVCGKAVHPLLQCYSWINLIPLDDKAILQGKRWERAINIVRFWRRLIFDRYDLCATLYYDRRYRLLTLPVRASRKLALSHNDREAAFLPGRPRADENARVLLQSIDSCQDHTRLPFPPDLLPESPWPCKVARRRIAIVPGGTNNLLRKQTVRRWPIENYVALTQRLLARGWEVALIGGQEDVWVRPLFKNMNVRDSIGVLPLPEVISACNSCDAVVSHDTGPLHLAGLSGTSLIGIFGPTDPSVFSPRRSSVTCIWGGQGFACRPCYDGRDFAPCQFNGCMHQVTPELVLRELDHLLEERDQGKMSPWSIVFPEGTSKSDQNLVVL